MYGSFLNKSEHWFISPHAILLVFCAKVRQVSSEFKSMGPTQTALDVNSLLGTYFLGPLAQSVEQRTFNPWVVGSIPTGPTLRFPDFCAYPA